METELPSEQVTLLERAVAVEAKLLLELASAATGLMESMEAYFLHELTSRTAGLPGMLKNQLLRGAGLSSG